MSDSNPSTPLISHDENTSFGAWTLVWVLYVTKLVTVVLVVAAHSYDAAVLVTITTWIWLGPLIALGAAPAMFRYRLRKVRTRRAALIQREWSLVDSNDVTLISAQVTPE